MFDQFIAEHDYVASLRFVELVEPAALLQRKIADVTELRFDASDFAVSAVKFTHRPHIDWVRTGEALRT